MNNYVPQTAEEYIELVRRLGAMIGTALDEMAHKEFISEEDKTKALSRAAEVVETISSLRGDSGLFREMRPDGIVEYQKEMYAIEDSVRAKLIQLGYEYPRN